MGSWSPSDQGFLNDVAGAVGSVVTINPVLANEPLTVSPGGGVFNVTLTQNTTFSVAGALAGVKCPVEVWLFQDATGGRSVTWWPGITWLPGSPPFLPQGAGQFMVVQLASQDGGATWIGSYGGPASIEPWRVVGAVGQPAFQNGWTTNVGAYAPLQFAKTASGLILVEGCVTNATATNNSTVVTTFPVGYRSLKNLRHTNYGWNGTASQVVDWLIGSDGTLTGHSANTPLSELHILTAFRSEQ